MVPKKIIVLSLIILSGCGNPPAPTENPVTNKPHKEHKSPAAKPAVSYWTIGSFAAKDGNTEGSKFIKFVTEGNFSDSIQSNKTLYAEVLINKKNAGIFLHKLKKSSPVENFSDPVQIKMTNTSGQELQMTSRRRWNKSGGILIEGNNNDYSQLRIFLLQNTGTVKVEIRDSGSEIYNFNLYLDGFSENFAKLGS